MKNYFKNLYKKIMNLLFPNDLKCMFCNKDIANAKEKPFCEECESRAPFNVGQRCRICDMDMFGESEVCDFCKNYHKNFDRCFSAMRYEKSAKNLVIKLKNNNAKYLAPKMAQLMFERIKNENIKFDIIIPVPLSAKSLKKRKYNQSKLLAEELSKLTLIEVNHSCLAKIKETKHQKNLNFNDRKTNLIGAFKVIDKKPLINRNVLLVDDVMTTGATANECSKTLKKYASNVFVVTFARNPLKNLEN